MLERVIIDIYLSCVDLQLPGNKSRSFLTLTYKKNTMILYSNNWQNSNNNNFAGDNVKRVANQMACALLCLDLIGFIRSSSSSLNRLISGASVLVISVNQI